MAGEDSVNATLAAELNNMTKRCCQEQVGECRAAGGVCIPSHANAFCRMTVDCLCPSGSCTCCFFQLREFPVFLRDDPKPVLGDKYWRWLNAGALSPFVFQRAKASVALTKILGYAELSAGQTSARYLAIAPVAILPAPVALQVSTVEN